MYYVTQHNSDWEVTQSHLSDTAVFESWGHDVTQTPHTETLSQSIAFNNGQIQGHEVLENVSADGRSACQIKSKKCFQSPVSCNQVITDYSLSILKR